MGVNEPRFAFMDDAAWRAVADARAAQKFTHLRVSLAGSGSDAALFQGPDVPNTAFFQALDQRIRYLNQKGIIADLVLSHRPADLLKALPSFDRRRRFVRYVAGRYAAFNVTWQAVDQFEGDPDGRRVLFRRARHHAAGLRSRRRPLADGGRFPHALRPHGVSGSVRRPQGFHAEHARSVRPEGGIGSPLRKVAGAERTDLDRSRRPFLRGRVG